jgi:hypothetical protein
VARHLKRAADIGLAAINIEGGLISPEKLIEIAATTPDAKVAADYHCPRGTSLRDEITRYFRIGQAHWQAWSRIDKPTITQTSSFAKALLQEAFGFEALKGPVDHTADGHRYRIAWEAKAGRVPVVVAAPIGSENGKTVEAFTKALPEFGDGDSEGVARRSPVALLQDWLNTSHESNWGLVFAGDRIRLMRDNASFTRPAYIEADLGAIFRDEMFVDFTAIWLLIHSTRFGAEGAPAADSPLERWREAGQRAGTAARERLRESVEETLLALGQGFLHANPELRAKLDDETLSMQAWFEQLLRVVYRLIFLAVAEDRDLLLSPDINPAIRSLYFEGYGFAHMRERSIRRSAHDHHSDAWEGAKIVFHGLDRGEKMLGLPALGGLFARGLTPDLDNTKLPNRAFMAAIFKLSWLMDSNRRVRINWRDMATEELGSVYEGLLELLPVREDHGRTFAFAGGAEAKGNARKISGSYYTPDSLVQTLLDSALNPVLDRAEAEGGADGILALNVIDPACGSGHFLLGAARRMATRVAQLRDNDAPDYPAAMRDVARNCIHGVDRNPMAVELAKVALWIETVEPGKPLGFLDANIQCGDSLLGIFDLKALEEGIPDDAYKPLVGDDKETAKWFAKRNKAEKVGQGSFDWARGGGGLPPAKLAAEMDNLRHLPEDTVEQVEAKRQRFAAWTSDPKRWATKVACDLFIAAFLLPKNGDVPVNANSVTIPTTAHMRTRLGGGSLYGPLEAAAIDAAEHARAFHWPLAFPEVMIARGGFDLVLGNPPWDAMSPDVKEWFAKYDPAIRSMSPDDQKARLEELLELPGVREGWENHQQALYRAANFMRNSGRYRLFAEGNLGKGDFNVYRMFVELAVKSISPRGSAAQFVPENLYNGANASAIRKQLFYHMKLNRLIAFENTHQVWFEIHSAQKFCLYVAQGRGPTHEFGAAFKINSEAKLAALSAGLPFTIPVSLIQEFSPDAMAIPEFVHPSDVSIARKLYSKLPKFGALIPGAPNRVYMAELHMGNDRGDFGNDPDGIPVYEGRMVEAFDHRAKAYLSGRGRQAIWADLAFGSPDKAIRPQWRLSADTVPEKAQDRWNRYRLGFCDVGGATNQRFLMAALIPPDVLCGHSVPTILFEPYDQRLMMLWLGVANSFCLDFLARQKGALHMTLTLVDSLPLPRQFSNTPLEVAIAKVALVLSCTGDEMQAFWDDVAPLVGIGSDEAPFEDIPRRRQLRARLDVLVARDFFGLTKDEMRYLLDPTEMLGEDCGIETFGALKRSEIRRDGAFTSKKLILDTWDVVDVPY